MSTANIVALPNAGLASGDFAVFVGEGLGVETGAGAERLWMHWHPSACEDEPLLPQQQQQFPPPPQQPQWIPMQQA